MKTLTLGTTTITQFNEDNDFPLFRLNDIHLLAGNEARHFPKQWKKTASTQEYVDYLLSKGLKSPLEQNQILTVLHGGDQAGTYACEKLVLDYAAWLSPEFKDKVYDAFLDYHGVGNGTQATLEELERVKIAKAIAEVEAGIVLAPSKLLLRYRAKTKGMKVGKFLKLLDTHYIAYKDGSNWGFDTQYQHFGKVHTVGNTTTLLFYTARFEELLDLLLSK